MLGADDKTELPEASRVHINLWCLPGLFPGKKLFFFDVGVEIKAKATPVRSIQLLLPFRVEEGEWPDRSSVAQDLFEHVASADTSELIFGGPVNHISDASGHILKIGDYPDELPVMRVNSSSIKRVEDYQTRADSSLYEIALDREIASGQSAYIRVRWRVFGASPLWRWKRSSGGARVDLRICDVRDSPFAKIDRHLRSRLLDIREANIFLMASPQLQLVARSPEFKYLRTLEPRAWTKYLHGAYHRGPVRGLLVYYWRYSSTTVPAATAMPARPINADEPFRVFLDFNRVTSNAWWAQILRIIIAVMVSLLLIRLVQNTAIDQLRLTDIKVRTILQVLGVGTALSVLAAIEKVRLWTADRFLGPRLWVRKIERRLLAIGTKS